MAGNLVHKINLKIEKDNNESESEAHELCNSEDIVKKSSLHDIIKLKTMDNKNQPLLLRQNAKQELENLPYFKGKFHRIRKRTAAAFKMLRDHKKEWDSIIQQRRSATPYSRPNSCATKGELRSCEDIVNGESSLHDFAKLEMVDNEIESMLTQLRR